MSISGVKFVSLDSSMLGNLARDFSSKDETKRNSVRHFLDQLTRTGAIPFLCWHHFEELIKHENDDTAAERVAFLRALPLAAWVPTRDGSTLGGVVDLFVAECSAILDMGQNCTLSEVRDVARQKVIAFGSGADAVAPYENDWFDLRPYLWERERAAREIVAISRAQVVDISNHTVGSYLSSTFRPSNQVLGILKAMRLRMAGEIRKRGDKRIPNADEVAADFYDEVYLEGSQLLTAENTNTGEALAKFGVDLERFDPDTNMGDVLADVEFQSKLRVANRSFNLSFEDFRKAIFPELVPTWTVEKSIVKFGQLRGEHKGSELNDRHLACLAPYCHLTYVDKQTMEDIRRARQKSRRFAGIIGEVERVTTYEKASTRIGRGDF